jgi:putative aldouronate transport system substrate-binding protein
MKRLLLAATVVLALCAALTAQTVDKLPVTKLPPIEISAFTVNSMPMPPDDNRAYKLIAEKLGVTFKWDIAVGEKDQKIGVMIAGQDYPDLLHIDSPKFIDAGACIPLEDLIEKYAPNLKRHYQADPVVWNKMKEKDGHIYCLPDWGVNENGVTATWYSASAMWIQKAVMKEFGYPKITTIDEYFDLIAKYKAKHPTTKDGKPTIGFSILTYDWHKFCLINPPQFLAGYPNDGNGIVDPKTGKYRVHLNSPEAKRWFKILNAMNAKGLVDRDSFVDTYDQYLAKLANGQVLGIHDQQWQFNDAQKALISQDRIWETMMPLPIVFDKSIKPYYRDSPLPNLQRGWGISIKAKDPVRIIKFMDEQLDPAWQKVFTWGLEGVDYSYDKDGEPVCTPAQRVAYDDVTWKLHNLPELWYQEAPKLEGRFTPGGLATVLRDNPKEYLASQFPEDIEIFKAYKVNGYAELMDKNPPPNPPWYPAWQIAPTDGTPAQLAWAKAEETFLKYLPKVITAKPADFEKTWKEYTDALAKCNLKAYEDFVQAGINDRIKKYGVKK